MGMFGDLHLTFGIFLLSRASDGVVTRDCDKWLESVDLNFADGRGHITTTDDPARAIAFPHPLAAEDFYRAQPLFHPVRADGNPNRPLTAYHAMIQPIPQGN